MIAWILVEVTGRILKSQIRLHRFGAPHAVTLTGACCLPGAAWFASQRPALRAVMRPIYIEMGIIPDPSGPAFEDRAGAS